VPWLRHLVADAKLSFDYSCARLRYSSPEARMKLITCIGALSLAIASTSFAEPNESAAAFERLKTLSGSWDVVESRAGGKSIATYMMTGRGSVLIEDLRAGGIGGMMTAYHLDKGTLVLTHFCGAGNQPRMRLKGVHDGGRRMRFEIYDITNLADPDGYRSTAVDVTFISDDRVDLAYQGKQGGSESTQTFRLTRKSAAVVPASQSFAPRAAKGDVNDAFRRLMTLVGSWTVTERDNPKTRETATYMMTGAGSVVTEDLRAPAGSTGHAMGHMFTTYHMDKGQLVLTHFCGAGNQPRMRLRAVEDGGRRLSFALYDITNLADPHAYHSNAVDIRFLSDDRIDLVYTGKAGGKEHVQVFQLTRLTPAS
jgi:hypothetical protein